jgi:hypothetical protein
MNNLVKTLFISIAVFVISSFGCATGPVSVSECERDKSSCLRMMLQGTTLNSANYNSGWDLCEQQYRDCINAVNRNPR